jgi:hypothetical protein
MLLVFFRHMEVSCKAPLGHPLSRRLTVLGLLTGLGACGVAAFPFHVSHDAHNTFALLFFFGGATYMAAHTWLDFKHLCSTLFIRWIRLVATLVSFVSILATIALLGANRSGALTERTALMTASAFEIVCFAFFLVYWGASVE